MPCMHISTDNEGMRTCLRHDCPRRGGLIESRSGGAGANHETCGRRWDARCLPQSLVMPEEVLREPLAQDLHDPLSTAT